MAAKTRRAAMAATASGVLGAVALAVWPVSSRSSRAMFVVFALMALAGAFALLRHRRRLRWLPVLPIALVVVPLLLPGRARDPAALRARHLSALRSFEGSPYVWGGEARHGIDCSGLVRRALRDAAFREGLATANPALLRVALDLWWNDASARALGEGHRDLTREIASAPSARELSPDIVVPGDIAVTHDGVHVLAALGEGAWIEADPQLGRVVILQAGDDNPWLHVRVRLLRWRLLE